MVKKVVALLTPLVLFYLQTEGLPSVLPAPGFNRTLPAISPPFTGGKNFLFAFDQQFYVLCHS